MLNSKWYDRYACSFVMWFFLSHFNPLSSSCLFFKSIYLTLCRDISKHINFPIFIHKKWNEMKWQCDGACKDACNHIIEQIHRHLATTYTHKTHARTHHIYNLQKVGIFFTDAKIVCWFRMNEIQITYTSIGWMCISFAQILYHVYFGSSFSYFSFHLLVSHRLNRTCLLGQNLISPCQIRRLTYLFSCIDLWIIIGLSESLRKQRIHFKWIHSVTTTKLHFRNRKRREREKEKDVGKETEMSIFIYDFSFSIMTIQKRTNVQFSMSGSRS